MNYYLQTSKLLLFTSLLLNDTVFITADNGIDIDFDVDPLGSTTNLNSDKPNHRTPTTKPSQPCEIDYETFAKNGLGIQSVISLLESENDEGYNDDNNDMKSCTMDLNQDDQTTIEMRCDATGLKETIRWMKRCEDYGGEVIQSVVALLCAKAKDPMNSMIKAPICRPPRCEEKALFVSLANLLSNTDCDVLIERESDVIDHHKKAAEES